MSRRKKANRQGKKKAARPARGERPQSKPLQGKRQRSSTASDYSRLKATMGLIADIVKAIIAKALVAWWSDMN